MFTIFILELEGNKYYVGKTDKTVDEQFAEHLSGTGAEWTKLHCPVGIVDTIYDCDVFDEDKYVKKYMSIYGIDNVRGGTYLTVTLSNEITKSLNKEILTAQNKCYRCNKEGHVANKCIEKIMETVEDVIVYIVENSIELLTSQEIHQKINGNSKFKLIVENQLKEKNKENSRFFYKQEHEEIKTYCDALCSDGLIRHILHNNQVYYCKINKSFAKNNEMVCVMCDEIGHTIHSCEKVIEQNIIYENIQDLVFINAFLEDIDELYQKEDSMLYNKILILQNYYNIIIQYSINHNQNNPKQINYNNNNKPIPDSDLHQEKIKLFYKELINALKNKASLSNIDYILKNLTQSYRILHKRGIAENNKHLINSVTVTGINF